MSAPTHDVAIIGAGFTGVALAIQLIRSLPAGARIVLIGSPQETGRGQAYGTERPEHLLNVRAERMSLFPDDPSHFVRWLKRQWPHRDPADKYVARESYGRYVRDTMNVAVAESRQHVHLDIIEGTAVEVERTEGSFSIRLASGEQYRAAAAALCTGNGRSDFPLRVENIADAVRDFMVRQPFADYRMGTVKPDARVLFIGTGLTMIDQVLTLDRTGYIGPILAVSRRGLLPAGHRARRTEPRAIDVPTVGDLTLSGLFALIVEATRVKVALGGDWRAIIDGLRPRTQELWQRLSAADQRRFLRHLESFWSVHRHRMAPEAAERVAALRASGRLKVLAGRVVGIRRAVRGITAALRARGSRTIELRPFDWVINCTGAGRGGPAADPLLARVIARGLARPDRHGRGLDVGTDARLIDRGGKPVAGFYAAGPLTAGRFLEITAVPDIRVQVAEIAGAIAGFVAEVKKPTARLTRGGSR